MRRLVTSRPSHQDLHCLQFCYCFLTEIPVCNNGLSKFRNGKVHLRYLGIKGLNIYAILDQTWTVASCTLQYVPLATWIISQSRPNQYKSFAPQHEKSYLLACAPNKDPNQPAHPCSLTRVLVFRMKKRWFLGYQKCTQWRFWSDFFPTIWLCAGWFLGYSRTSLSRTRLFRITAYLEVKIWSLF